jgi:hypothetical protein
MIIPAMLMNEVLRRLVLVLSVSHEPCTYIPHPDSILKSPFTWFLKSYDVDPFLTPFYMPLLPITET